MTEHLRISACRVKLGGALSVISSGNKKGLLRLIQLLLVYAPSYISIAAKLADITLFELFNGQSGPGCDCILNLKFQNSKLIIQVYQTCHPLSTIKIDNSQFKMVELIKTCIIHCKGIIVYIIDGQPTELTDNDVMTIAEAGRYLGVTGQSISYYIQTSTLTAVTSPGKQTSRRKPKRWVLRSEVETLKLKFTLPAAESEMPR
jgi:hypothetical protein